MKKTTLCLAATLFLCAAPAFATTGGTSATPQQTKMKVCTAQYHQQKIAKSQYHAFIGKCLKSKSTTGKTGSP